MTLSLSAAEVADLRKICDWNLDVTNVANSGIFSPKFAGPSRLAGRSDLLEFANELARTVAEAHRAGASGQRKTFGARCEGIRFRVQPLEYPYFQLRTLHDQVMTMDELGFPKPYVDVLLSRELRNRGGLVLVGGPTGSGKTTTVSSMLVARLKAFGGYALTLEDVLEYSMDGWHGERGLCRQVQVQTNYRDEMRGALRAFPSNDRSMLLFGEICDDVSAGELLRTALDGHLVLTTMHGNDIIAILERLVTLCKREMDISEARSLLSQSLRLVIHQLREHNVPQVTMLDLLDPTARGAVNIIGNYETRLSQLQQTIDEQQIRFQLAGM